MPDRAGQQIGNYRLLRLLGRGAFAEVYLGEHVYLKRLAALKLLQTSLEDEDVERFLVEAQTLARLNHPNIVRVHEFAVEQGMPILVMDYAPRRSLRQHHPPGSCLSLETTVSYIKQVATALQYAHNQNVIHRDIKPENILLGANQEVLLSDFGIALFSPTPEQLSTQEMTGTLPYMAPEQIRGKPGFASDQYSLAIVAYEWLCGVRPFEGSQWAIAHQHVFTPPPRLREKDPSLPQAVEDVVLKALAKGPQDRYVSVQMFAQALERASQVSSPDLQSADLEVTAPLDPDLPAAPVTPKFKRVFISASHDDAAFVALLKADLQRHGVAVWNDYQHKQENATDQEDVMRQAIRAVDVVLLVVSPHTQSSETIAEHLRIASLYQRRLVFVWAAGNDIVEALPREWGKTVQVDLIDARDNRYELVLDEMIACLVEETELPSHVEPVFEPRNPYKGLRAFTGDDTSDFFGRDSLIEELVDMVKGALTLEQSGTSEARLLAVIGPSGSGKSSVVMAGLLPRLQRGALPRSEQWMYLDPVVPGIHPLEALALTLAPHFPDRSLKVLREDLEDNSARGLHLLARQLVKDPAQKLVLLIDQFEELFTLTTTEEERQHLIDLLITAMTELQGTVFIILTLRADFYDRPMSYPTLGRLILRHQAAVLPMDVHDLRAVIKRPAALPDVQLTFEGNLVGDLLFEVQGQVGALPLLQFTLDQLFERRDGHKLTLEAYREIGGVKGALAKHAESTYAALPSEEHRKLARALFLRLIDPGLTEQDTTRRRATLAELVLPTQQETELLQQVTAYFLAARLLTTNEIAGTPTIEVSHETLIREWTRLAEWLREARDDIRLLQTLSEDVAEWKQHSQPRDRLYRGSQLKDARAWAARNIPSRDEDAFLRSSSARRMHYLVSVIAITLLLVSTTGLLSWLLLRPPDPTHVTNLNDSGPGSLRQAIATAKPGYIITFDASLRGGTIKLTSDNLSITQSMTIRGLGSGLLTISGNHGDRQIKVAQKITVTISGVTITSFDSSGIKNYGVLTLEDSIVSGNTTPGNGGGIENFESGRLTLINSVISGNASASERTDFANNPAFGNGGGIYNHGMFKLINSIVSGNRAARYGGGIYNGGGKAVATITNGTMLHNTACQSGGGIANAVTLTLIDSTVSNNSVGHCVAGIPPNPLPNTIRGGGIYNASTAKTITITDSTISGNTVFNGPGGGIFDNFSEGKNTLVITNSTIAYNTASGNGGGFVFSGSQATITFCTIYGNIALDGGGIFIKDGRDAVGNSIPSHVQMQNSLVARNHQSTGQDIVGTLTTGGYNLIQNFTGVSFVDPMNKHTTDIIGDTFSDLKIDTVLRNNDGPTESLALLPGSPAIDKILLDACRLDGIASDQRGVKRPQGKGCDIGAYEYRA